MQVRVPVDVMILQSLSDGEHANPMRVRYLIRENHYPFTGWEREDMWSLDYVTQRMGELRKLGLLERVAPDDSGLYRITDLGHVVLQRWVRTNDKTFDLPDALNETEQVEPRVVNPDEIEPPE